MPSKDVRYYKNTIWLKANASAYFLLEKMGFLTAYKTRQKIYFHNLYETHFIDKKTYLNHSFSTIYTAYDMFENRSEIEPHLTFDKRKIAMCRSDVNPKYYNPLLCAHFALVCYNDFIKTKQPEALDFFWMQVYYLEKTALENQHRFYYDWQGHHFYSGITQSVIASVFTRAFLLTKEGKWKDLARDTLSQMFVPVGEGGNFTHDTEGYVWIEEYPKMGRLGMVLNGFIYSLIGVYEYLILCDGDDKLETYCQKMTESLFKTLYFYKFGRFTRYGRFEKTFENIDYQGRNYYLFKHLFELTNNEAFETLMHKANADVNWDDFYRFYSKPTPSYFKQKE